MKKIIIAAAAAAAVFSGPAAASDTVSVHVPTADLNLESEAGLATLDARIHAAVRKACGRVTSRLLWNTAQTEQCRKDALDEAMAQLSTLLAGEQLVAQAN